MSRHRSLVLVTLGVILVGGCKTASKESSSRTATSTVTLTSAAAAPPDPPSPEPIPNRPVSGVVRGAALDGAAVRITYRSGRWQLEARTPAASLTTDLMIEPAASALSISSRDSRKRANASAFLSVGDPKKPKAGSSDHVGSAVHWIKLTRWDVVAYDAAKGGFQPGGRATGRLYVEMRGDAKEGEKPESWCAGEFTDAPVVYWEDPAAKTR